MPPAMLSLATCFPDYWKSGHSGEDSFDGSCCSASLRFCLAGTFPRLFTLGLLTGSGSSIRGVRRSTWEKALKLASRSTFCLIASEHAIGTWARPILGRTDPGDDITPLACESILVRGDGRALVRGSSVAVGHREEFLAHQAECYADLPSL